MSRPQGVWWARTGPRQEDRLCEDGRHGVYRRLHTRPKIGSPGQTETVEVWACEVCWPLVREEGATDG